VGIAILGTIVSASAAAIVNFTLVSPTFAITIWVGLIVAGGIIGVILALPIVRILERAQVKKVKTA
jgi:predicted membrane protein